MKFQTFSHFIHVSIIKALKAVLKFLTFSHFFHVSKMKVPSRISLNSKLKKGAIRGRRAPLKMPRSDDDTAYNPKNFSAASPPPATPIPGYPFRTTAGYRVTTKLRQSNYGAMWAKILVRFAGCLEVCCATASKRRTMRLYRATARVQQRGDTTHKIALHSLSVTPRMTRPRYITVKCLGHIYHVTMAGFLQDV